MSLSDVAALATAVGVVVLVVQLGITRRQDRTAFEDGLAREYREIALSLPVTAFFDEPDPNRPPPPLADCLENYLRYIDLSNAQVFLRKQRRISGSTWANWKDGIGDNLGRDEFKEAWAYVRMHITKSFHELAALDAHWEHDPGWWDPPWYLVPWKRLRGFPDQPVPASATGDASATAR